MSKLILLTATIAPSGDMPELNLRDRQLRQRQYEAALRFYLVNTDLRLLFVENSGTDISYMFSDAIGKGRLEMLNYVEDPEAIRSGKGAGETNILRHALKHSMFMRDADYIFKITGRHIIRNIAHFEKHSLLSGQDVVAMSDLEKGFTLSAFFICKGTFLSTFFLPHAVRINDTKKFYFEHALTHAIFDCVRQGGRFEYFDILPRLAGTSGTRNATIRSGYLRWLVTNRIFLSWKLLKVKMARRLAT